MGRAGEEWTRDVLQDPPMSLVTRDPHSSEFKKYVTKSGDTIPNSIR
jgi:hypothetical protein